MIGTIVHGLNVVFYCIELSRGVAQTNCVDKDEEDRLDSFFPARVQFTRDGVEAWIHA